MWYIIGGIYVGSFIVSRVMLGLLVKAEEEKAKNEGYIDLSPPRGKYETILEEIQLDFMLLIPIINIVMACLGIYKFNEFYNEHINEGVKEGKIRKMTPEEIEAIKENAKEEQEKTILCTTQNIPMSTIKPYSEMTNEEKLRFLGDVLKIVKQEQSSLKSEDKSNQRGAYIKK